MKPNPDNRVDNVSRIQYDLDMTTDNIHRASEIIEKKPDPQLNQVLKTRNERRMDALDSMRQETRNEINSAKSSRFF